VCVGIVFGSNFGLMVDGNDGDALMEPVCVRATVQYLLTPTTVTGVKVGFHYPSSRAELTARELWCIF